MPVLGIPISVGSRYSLCGLLSVMTKINSSSNTLCARYHQVHLVEDSRRAMTWKVLADYLSRYVPRDARVLELGAGYCYWINSVRARYKVALDIWDQLGLYAAPDVHAVQCDLSSGLPIGARAGFGVAMASNLLEHLDLDVASRLVGDVFACLHTGGRFVIVQPNFRFAYQSYFDDYTHRTIFTDRSLPNLLRSHGFLIERVEARFMPYSLCGTRLPVLPWLIRAYLHSPFKPMAGQMLVIGQKPPRA